MAQPQVSWYSGDNLQEILNWDLSIVDAGAVSPDVTFLIWNNRGGSADLSDMTNCSITTKDSLGGDTGEVITDKWIEAKCVSDDTQLTFTPIGGTTVRSIKALGQTENVIKGTLNTGNLTDDTVNFAKVTLHANVPSLATSGLKEFLLRVAYQYI